MTGRARRAPGTTSSAHQLFFLAIATAALSLSCAPDTRENTGPVASDQPNQLQGHPVVATPGVLRAERISDGKFLDHLRSQIARGVAPSLK